MCVSCGCGPSDVTISGAQGAHRHHDHGHSHDHGHEHSHEHGHDHEAHGHHDHAAPSKARMVEIERGILAKNDTYAAQNRARLNAGGIVALNILAGPGAGKTTLLVETLRALGGQVPAAVIEGDQQTANDAERIRATGTPAVQINTGKGCHLDAHMVGHALDELPLPPGGVLFIENVGNLVCPAAFDLGEEVRVTLLSVTEGEDKPLKYPDIFESADLVLLTKTDLLPHLDVDVDAIERNIARINPVAPILHTNAKGANGLNAWLGWLGEIRRQRLDQLAAETESKAKTLRAAVEALP